jgi:hypothetical protein
MKRYHHNATNEPMTFRTWMLNSDYVIGEHDFKWLTAFGIPIRIDKPEQTFETASGRSHTIYGKPTYTLDTTTDKQRNMLMLKYGSDIILLQEEHVMANSFSVCTLDRLVL